MTLALFVDLDGTLADTIPGLYALYCDLLKSHGIKGSKKEFRELNGRSLEEIVLILNERYSLSYKNEKVLEMYRENVFVLYSKIKLFPDVRKTLEMFQKKGASLYLVTSAARQLAQFFLNTHGLDELFSAIVTTEGLPGKPSPAIYQKALKIADVAPNEGMAIEDSPNGVKAAMAAGLFTLRLSPRSKALCLQKKYATVRNWQEIRLMGLSRM